MLVVLIGVVLSDTGGYAAGVFFGRHPMAPTVSPKKSWEGFGGSVVAAAVGSALSCYFLLDVDFWWGALFGVAISVAAVLGDLGESMLKRDLGVKDMSHLLPGHGGLMDRLDSILFAVPTAYLLCRSSPGPLSPSRRGSGWGVMFGSGVRYSAISRTGTDCAPGPGSEAVRGASGRPPTDARR